MKKFFGLDNKEKENIELLMNMGFSKDHAEKALKECNGNAE